MSEKLSTVYEPAIEAAAIEIWQKGNYFAADSVSDKESYAIVIPPPNVTAALHLGHALNNTLQDVLIRFRRMQGFNTLWMPGTDHAGIATQTVVEKRLLSEEGRRRTDFEREEFVARVREWKDEYEKQIINQLKSMGCSCDWERTRFTMDEMCAKAVRANFFKLFKDGLIYRGKRLVNWDPATQTVLADDEVEHETVNGFFWYMQYPLEEAVEIDGKTVDHVTVATTRPETMLGDTAVAMNPSDRRAKYLVGKKVRLPIVGRLIPIVADEHVVLPNPDSEDEKAKYSTGFLKVTPAHDPDDWQIGLRHELDVINVMAPDGSISDKHGWEDADEPEAQNLLGMDRFEAREAIVEWFRQENLLEDIREYAHEVGHSYRSHVPIEPYLSDQWYVAVKKPIAHLAEKFGERMIDDTDIPANSLAGLALKPVLDGRVKFTPDRYTSTYKNWLENLRDWPISRQLWWGHQIPIWYLSWGVQVSGTNDYIWNEKEVLGHFNQWLIEADLKDDIDIQLDSENCAILICTRNEKADAMLRELSDVLVSADREKDEKYGERYPIGPHLCQMILSMERDPDVLDTWFSSALWPFSTLGWPDETDTLKTFYPGDVLCTAREIITLWVSRMVMMGQYCVGDIPFKDVYIHAMIQDGKGRKMSKSLGNGIDPLVAIDSHGADAMRFTLASMTTDTQDVRMPVAPMELPDGRTVNTSPKFDIGRNFCNKLWNASRFAMMNLEGTDASKFDKEKLAITDKWILSRLGRCIAEVTSELDEFKYNEPLNTIYRFFWNDFCDWYLEWVKPRMQDEADKPIAQNVLAFVLDRTLRLLHPFIPFITEGIFQGLNELAPERKLKGICESGQSDALIAASWPERLDGFICDDVEAQVEIIQGVIRVVREVRNQYGISPKDRLAVSVAGPVKATSVIDGNSELLCHLAGLGALTAGENIEKPKNASASLSGELQIYVHDVVDVEAERKRLMKQKELLANGIRSAEGKLGNDNFVSRAKPEVVEKTRQTLKELSEQMEALEKHLGELDS